MPLKALNTHQKAVQTKIDTLIEAAKISKLKGELAPLRDNFAAAKKAGITVKTMATEIVGIHPLFKGQPITAVTELIDQVIANSGSAA